MSDGKEGGGPGKARSRNCFSGELWVGVWSRACLWPLDSRACVSAAFCNCKGHGFLKALGLFYGDDGGGVL